MIGATRPADYPWRWAAICALCAITFLAGLSRQAITDSDEAFYAEAGREMVLGGDWITPHYNFDPRLQKPILYYWLVAATYEVAGVGEGQARFWSAMAGVGLALLAAAVARRWYGPGPGLIAGAIAATSFGATILSRMALPDAPLAFFVTLAAWAAFEALGADERQAPATPWTRRRWLMLSSAALALGTLTKGPVAPVLLILAAGPVIAWEIRRSRQTPDARPVIRAGDAALALAVFAAIAVPWFAAVTRAQGVGYLHQFFVGENIDRFATTQNNDLRPFWFYLPIVAGGLLPWSPFAIVWLAPAAQLLRGRRALSTPELRLLAWTAAPLVFFSISIGKQPRYILPCLPPLAVLLGASIWRRIERHRAPGVPRDRLMVVAGVLSGSVLVALGLLILRVAPVLREADPGWSRVGPVALAAGGLAVCGAALTAGGRVVAAALTLAGALAGFVIQASVFAPGRPEPVELVASRMLADGQPSTVCACGAFARNLTFYTHAKTVIGDPVSEIDRFLSSPDRVMAAIDSDALASFETRQHRTLPRLLEVSYLNVAALRLGSLFDPNPAHALQHVIVVANR